MANMKQRLSEQEVRQLLADEVARAGNQSRYADEKGISRTYLHTVLHGHQQLGAKILESLGLRKIIEFEREESK